MDEQRRPRSTVRYEVRVDGHLDERWSAWFDGLTLSREPDGTTIVCGALDQSALHGLLGRVRDLGITLLSVRAVDSGDHDPGQ